MSINICIDDLQIMFSPGLTPIGCASLSFFGQVVAAALDAAKHRRARVEQLAALATPGASGKRKTIPKNDSSVASTSTTASSTEKVTPDPKHIRTGDGDGLGAPEPKALFVSPDGREAADEGGV